MYSQSFDITMFQTAQDDNHEQEAAPSGKPSRLDRLLATIERLLLPPVYEIGGQEHEEGDPSQPEPDLRKTYVMYVSEYWDGGVYWFDV